MTTFNPEARPEQERIVKVDAYRAFQAREGIPVVTGFAVDDLRTLELGDWARLNCRGAYINLDGAGDTNDAYVAEIPPGGKMAPERHIFEKNIYVLAGRGATLVGDDPNSQVSFEWKKGSIFSVPVNVRHQHLNGSGAEPARFVAVTTAPITMNLFHNEGFIFDNPYVFEDRIGNPKSYQGEGKMWTATTGRTNAWETNFVPDVETFTTFTWAERGAGGAHIKFELADQTQTAHISEFPVGTYKKAHRHGPGAHVIILKGEGYSLLWPSHGSPHNGMERLTGSPAPWSCRRTAGSTSTSTAGLLPRVISRSGGAARSTTSRLASLWRARRMSTSPGRRPDRVRERGSCHPRHLPRGARPGRRRVAHGGVHSPAARLGSAGLGPTAATGQTGQLSGHCPANCPVAISNGIVYHLLGG